MAKYVTREGPFGTVNVWTKLITCGAQGTVNQINVDKGYSSIKELWVAGGVDSVPTDTIGGMLAIRLEGTGLKYGPVDIPVYGWGVEVTGNDTYARWFYASVLPVDIALVEGGSIWVNAAQTTTDLGTPEMAVTLCMTNGSAGLKRYDFRHLTSAAAVDTKVQMTRKIDDTGANQIRVPGDTNKITKLFLVQGGLGTVGATGGVGIVRLEGDGMMNGPQAIVCGGTGCLSTGTGVDGGLSPVSVIPTDIPVRPGGLLYLYEEQTGVTTGGFHCALGLEFSG